MGIAALCPSYELTAEQMRDCGARIEEFRVWRASV
jgi:hypothetical protein